MSDKKLNAEHGIVCYLPKERMGYFAWPSIVRTESGKLIVGASGLRFDHMCPWGKTVLMESADAGMTWTAPQVLNNTPLDDRDVGLVSLGGEEILVSWFTADNRSHYDLAKKSYDLSEEEISRWDTAFSLYDEDAVARWCNPFTRYSPDAGVSWSDYHPTPVSSPHGPICLADGSVFYFGKEWWGNNLEALKPVSAYASEDHGKTWTKLGEVPRPEGVKEGDLCEAHVLEMPSGKLVGLLRYEGKSDDKDAYMFFSMFQSDSLDGGRTWSEAKYLGIYGSPPHLMRHSSGAIICTYSYRKDPLGHRVMFSWDEGETWDSDWILRDDAPGRDHGYPASVEMPDGQILSVYYQRANDEYKNTGILSSRWELPAR